MIPEAFISALRELHLTQDECAELMKVTGRTVRRWASGEGEIPGPVERALQAWLRLARSGVGWHPEVALLGYESFERMRETLADGRRYGPENFIVDFAV